LTQKSQRKRLVGRVILRSKVVQPADAAAVGLSAAVVAAAAAAAAGFAVEEINVT
jgi:hypothetical protein